MRPTLPSGWQWVPLSRLVSKIEAGKSFKCEERPPVGNEAGIVKVSAVTWGTYDEEESKTIRDPDRVNEAYLIRPGDFLFSRANTLQLVGACVLVRTTGKRLLLSDKILRLVMPDVMKPWLLWFLRSAEGRRQIEGLSTGNQESMRNIGQERIGQIEVPIPAMPTMQLIVSRIEELFSEIDEGERALERVQKLVERYRQSVLKAAVTGELTASARAEGRFSGACGADLLERALARCARLLANQMRRGAPVGPDVAKLPALPTGWVWASVDQLCSQFGNGLSRKPAHLPPGEPILRISAVRPLAVDPHDLRYYVAEPGERLDGCFVERGDLLFTRYNGSRELVGVSGVYRGRSPVLHPDKLIKLRVISDDLVLSDYLEIALNSGESWSFLTSCVKTSAGQHGIAGADIKRAPVPLPPLEEQKLVVALWRQFESQIAALRTAVPFEARRGRALRQAVLKAAFSGQLVPQDPNDEPASTLLARLSSQAAESPTTSKRRGRPPRHITTTP